MSGLSTVAVLESTMGTEIGSECTFMRQDFEKNPQKTSVELASARRVVRVLSCGVVLCLFVRDVDVGVDSGALHGRTISGHS